MSRKNEFALSWGRKMIFGLGWILTSLVALSYFRSMIVPQTLSGWFYYLLTYVGHYGMILTILYFFFYWPVVALLPTYYISRFWSIFLLMGINSIIFLDSYVFSKYRFHINSFLFDFLKSGAGKEILNLSKNYFFLLMGMGLVIFLTLWIRGERIWRQMQARFSNPVKHWYLMVIFSCFIGSHLFHMYGDAKGASNITRISQLFPFHFPLTSKGFLKSQGLLNEDVKQGKIKGYKDFYYPAKVIICKETNPLNYIFISFEAWPAEDFNKNTVPYIWHLADHAIVFTNHFSGGADLNEGLFSIFYSLPPSYIPSVLSGRHTSVLHQKLTSSGHQVLTVGDFQNDTQLSLSLPLNIGSLESVKDLILQHGNHTELKPFFINVVFPKSNSYINHDEWVRSIVEILTAKKLLSETVIVLTGTHAKDIEAGEIVSPQSLKVPMIVVWPERDRKVVDTFTSHYDVVPTLMQEGMRCGNKENDYSFGVSLFSKNKRDLYVAGNYKNLGIFDFELNAMMSIRQYKGLEVLDFYQKPYTRNSQTDLKVLNTLEHLTYFNKQH